MMEPQKLHFQERASWRIWLAKNYKTKCELWLVFYKKHTGIPTISYDAAIEEALCFGWIDSLIKRLDNDRYARKFTPRSKKSKWSESNLQRITKLQAAGLMTPAGLAKIRPVPTSTVPSKNKNLEIPFYFQKALSSHPSAQDFFTQLAPSYQRNMVVWIDSAKREETRQKRLTEVITLLKQKKKLGMK